MKHINTLGDQYGDSFMIEKIFRLLIMKLWLQIHVIKYNTILQVTALYCRPRHVLHNFTFRGQIRLPHDKFGSLLRLYNWL